MVSFTSKDFKNYTKNCLEGMDEVEPWKSLPLDIKMKVIRLLWRHLNTNIQVGNGIMEDVKPIVKHVKTAMTAYKFLDKVIFPLIL